MHVAHLRSEFELTLHRSISQRLSDLELASRVARNILLQGNIQSVAKMIAKVLTEKQPSRHGVWLSPQVSLAWRVFHGFADAKNVFCRNRRIQRNSVPVRKGISCF